MGAATATPAADVFSMYLRRLKSDMKVSFWLGSSDKNQTPPGAIRYSAGQAHATGSIKQMGAGGIGPQADGLPPLEVMAFAKHAGDRDAGDFGEYLGVGPCGLDHHHFSRNAVIRVGQIDVFGARAVNHFLSVLAARMNRRGQGQATDEFHRGGARAALKHTRQEIHGGRADEAGDELVRRVVV